MHYSQYPKPTNTLYSVGKELPLHVSVSSVVDRCMSLNRNREIFGTSEDETQELDHSKDTENGTVLQLLMGSELLTLVKPKR